MASCLARQTLLQKSLHALPCGKIPTLHCCKVDRNIREGVDTWIIRRLTVSVQLLLFSLELEAGSEVAAPLYPPPLSFHE